MSCCSAHCTRRRRHLATLALPQQQQQQLLRLLLILASCSLFLNFPSLQLLKEAVRLVLFIIHLLHVILFPTLRIMASFIFMHAVYFSYFIFLLHLQV